MIQPCEKRGDFPDGKSLAERETKTAANACFAGDHEQAHVPAFVPSEWIRRIAELAS